MNISGIIIGVISRSWASRNQVALEKHFNITLRRVTVGELFVGFGFVIVFLAYMAPTVRNQVRKQGPLSGVMRTILYYLVFFRLLRIRFLLTLLQGFEHPCKESLLATAFGDL